MLKNKLVIHVAGGGGINIGSMLVSSGIKTDSKKLDVEINFLDASDRNESIVPDGHSFYKITSNKLASLDICGSGGERAINVDDKVFGVKEYLDKINVVTNKVNEFHVVIFSGSGGSGSVLGSMLVKELLIKDITTCALMIGDKKDLMSTQNTLKSLKTMSSIASITNSALSLIFEENRSSGKNRETIPNERVLNFINTLRSFLASDVVDVDTQDMRNFFNQHLYQSIKIPTGVYMVEVHDEDIKERSYGRITTARVISENKNSEIILSDNIIHVKQGIMGTNYHGNKKSLALISLNALFSVYVEGYEAVLARQEKITDELVSSEVYKDIDGSGLVL